MSMPVDPARGSPVFWSGEGPARRMTLDLLDRVAGLAHAFTVRGSEPATVARAVTRRARVAIRLLRQVHGAGVHVHVHDEEHDTSAAVPPPADAQVARGGTALLGVRIADCVPILVCDPRRRLVAAVHAGWRGTAAGVLAATLETLRTRFDSRPEDLRVGLGPAIGPCCFEVGEEVVERLLRRDPGAARCVRRVGPRPHIDLIEANRRQALAGGVRATLIRDTGLCTVCHPEILWSHRRDGEAAGRMYGLIGWTDRSATDAV